MLSTTFLIYAVSSLFTCVIHTNNHIRSTLLVPELEYMEDVLMQPVRAPGPPIAENGQQVISQNEPKVRKDFSESFLWQDVEIRNVDKRRQNGDRGREEINVKVPESITSYVFSGVSLSNRFGLAIPAAYPKLTVFQPFFIQLTLPFSIKRGEVLSQNIFIFNFLESQQTVKVSIKSNDLEIDFVKPKVDGWESEKTNI